MRTYLLLAVGLALASCSTTKPKPAPVAQSEPTSDASPGNATQTPAALPVMGVKKGIIARLLAHSKLETPVSSGVATPTNATQVPRKCKGCTFNTVAGDQTNAAKKAQLLGEGASVKGDTKAKGNAAVSQDSSTQNALTGEGNIAATKGNNNATTQTKQDTSKEALGPLAVLANNATSWLPWVLGAVAVGCVGYGIYYFWFLIPRRKSAANQA